MQVRSLKKKRSIHAILFIENLKVGKTKLLLRDSYMYDTIIKKTPMLSFSLRRSQIFQ